MKQVRSKLFYPLVAGLIALSSTVAYQLAKSNDLGPNAAFAEVKTSNQGFHPAPDFALKDINGKIVRLSDFRGKVVVLNFWATWCPPCQKEIPDFNELQTKYGAQVQFLGIALDDQGLLKVKPFVEAHPMGYPVLLPDASIGKNYGDMSSIPTTIMIDRKGNIQSSYVGMRQKAVVESSLVQLLGAQ